MTKQPMLCARTNEDNIARCLKNSPLIALPKIDGIRCLIVGGRALSRKFKLIPNNSIRRYLEKKRFEGLDGELVIGDGTQPFNINTEGIMRVEGEPSFYYWVFDLHNSPKPYYRRLSDLESYASSRVTVVPSRIIENVKELLNYESECLDQGYEGLVLRHPQRLYKFGRSTLTEMGMMKLKRFEDSEAKIMDISPLMRNTNPQERNELGKTKRSSRKEGLVEAPTMGSMRCWDPVKKWTFDLGMGPGLTSAERARLWQMKDIIGKKVKYSWFGPGTLDGPRHPKYLGIRED